MAILILMVYANVKILSIITECNQNCLTCEKTSTNCLSCDIKFKLEA